MTGIDQHSSHYPVVTSCAEENVAMDLYEIGKSPPMGHVPKHMYAWKDAENGHVDPEKAMQIVVVDTPMPRPEDALIMLMAAG
ncbi:hypothetical protein GGD67_002815 [Bradyrhizobium sp. IAR9]|uniref:hypothetical protein n=1 Tax=Bradyrhizobium sp. IAR9 TaxID=2663841 RepID=UPI0015CA2276|nr:hypothetical protein [Bradyrhizobium sp. IAR9]NYG45357.1 hypothetical protein [Bradyrhizobium sp. IAR9]